jgi:oligopeptide/dipeptide ABC transporter ATP-binding protein
LLDVRGLVKHYPVKNPKGRGRALLRAVDGVSFPVARGETFGLVGESGCGKTTTGKLVLRLIEPTAGHVFFDEKDIFALGKRDLRLFRRHMQIVFQDPFGSMDPRMRVSQIVAEPLRVNRALPLKECRRRVLELLDMVGLSAKHLERYPHEFSGGQRQRIVIARALALNPKLVVCDEPVSALDVSIQSQVINLLDDLKEHLGLTYLFIAHDLSLIRHVSNNVGVMYLGKIVEMGPVEDLYERPLHPYTKALLSAIPMPDPGVIKDRLVLSGDVPSPVDPPPGCRFSGRCPSVLEVCRETEPSLVEMAPGHTVACHLYH